MEVTVPLAFIAGLVSFLSPCVLPLVPAYIGYMGGRVTNTVAAQSIPVGLPSRGGTAVAVASGPTMTARLSTLTHGVAFVAGFTVIFVAIGLLQTAFLRQVGGESIALVRDIIARVGGTLIIFFGLHFMGALRWLFNKLLLTPQLLGLPFSALAALGGAVLLAWALVDWLIALPFVALFLGWLLLGGAFTTPAAFWTRTIEGIQRLLYADTRRQMVASGQQNYATSAIMGVTFAAGWTPCIGPIYGSILMMAANDVTNAGGMMIAYSLGLGVPFLLTALLLDRAQSLLRRLQRHLHKVELFAGAFLIVIGILVASGELQSLSQRFASGEFADFSFRMEECVVGAVRGEGDFFVCMNAPEA